MRASNEPSSTMLMLSAKTAPTVVRTLAGALVCAGLLTACHVSDLLNVPPPLGVQTGADVTTKSGAEQVYQSAKARFIQTMVGSAGSVALSGVLTDEFTQTSRVTGNFGTGINIDARVTSAVPGFYESGDDILTGFLAARSTLLIAAQRLQQFEPPSSQWMVGDALALVGYSEMMMAENFCAGVPLSQALIGGGSEYGMPLTTDSLFATAETHFDSALANAHGDTTVIQFANVGLARSRLGRGKFAEAAQAAANVHTGFAYNVSTQSGNPFAAPLATNLYEWQADVVFTCGFFDVADREGTNGLNFISANDPRLVIDSTFRNTCDGGKYHYPAKFGRPSLSMPIATGVEARMIEAEAALQAGQPAVWATKLNDTRAAAPQTYLALAVPLPPLTADSTTNATDRERVDVMFRERAFWLFGLGTRLGDLRRLLRLYKTYGYTPQTLYPVGPYPPNQNDVFTNYGTDVAFTLPTVSGGAIITNPNYRGCLVPPSQE